MNYILVDRLIYKNNIFKKSIITGSVIMASSYFTYKYRDDSEEVNDWRVKKSRCDKELTNFGQCLEKNNDNYDKCVDLLEAYKKCLQQK